MNLPKSGLVRRTTRYWELSRAWRGDKIYAGEMTIGALGRELQDLASRCTHNAEHKLENVVALQLKSVILNKKCRKTKPLPNVTSLADGRLRIQAKLAKRAMLQSLQAPSITSAQG